ncbi:hypothetical protein E2651_37325 [Streptomyces sp. MZ04]|nr:hypothetical protein E2651_37325 [Streptomyces sp. MZ04]
MGWRSRDVPWVVPGVSPGAGPDPWPGAALDPSVVADASWGARVPMRRVVPGAGWSEVRGAVGVGERRPGDVSGAVPGASPVRGAVPGAEWPAVRGAVPGAEVPRGVSSAPGFGSAA